MFCYGLQRYLLMWYQQQLKAYFNRYMKKKYDKNDKLVNCAYAVDLRLVSIH